MAEKELAKQSPYDLQKRAKISIWEKDTIAGREVAEEITSSGGLVTLIECDITDSQNVESSFRKLSKQLENQLI